MTFCRQRETLTPDGSTSTFHTLGTYVPGSVFVFWNGQLQPKAFVTELGGTTFETGDVIPAGDSLQVDYQSVI